MATGRQHAPLALLVLAATVFLMAARPGHLVESRSILNHIPGFELVRNLTGGLASRGALLTRIPGVELMHEVADNLANSVGNALDTHIIRSASARAEECLNGACPPRDPDSSRGVAEIIRSRGFEAEEHHVVTKDGYILTIQRIVNPLVDAAQRPKLKPVILQHGLMSSSVDWVINSLHVRPQRYEPAGDSTRDDIFEGAPQDDNSIEGHVRRVETLQDATPPPPVNGDSQEHPRALGFYLANQGYDVFLANSRGNIYGQRHVRMSSWNPRFWAFTFDEQIKYDLPDTAAYIQNLTGHTKLGYVGHSQGTAMMFGLLSDQPEYADVFEPVVMLAPVAYVSNTISPVKYFAAYTPIFEHVNMWFASSNVAVRYLAPLVCEPELIKNQICGNILFLGCGFDREQFDFDRVEAYMHHMPSGTSVKNIAHYGQEVLSGRFAHFNHGVLGNQIHYGRPHPPDYDLSRIRSKSLVLFTAENDWLASPKDVAKLHEKLQVPIFRWHNITEDKPKWNHIDFVYGKDNGQLVNKRIVDAFHHFD